MVRFAKQDAFWWFWVVLAALWATVRNDALAANPTEFIASAPPELQVLLDVSADMAGADATGARLAALEVLPYILPAGTRVAVWGFAERAQPIVQAARVTGLWRRNADIALGALTDMPVPGQLATALSAPSFAADSEVRHLLVISAGGPGPGISRAQTLKRWVPKFQAAGVVVHAIAIGADSDRVLLEQLAVGTGGYFQRVQEPAEMTRALLRTVDHALPPAQLPMHPGGRFAVDAGIREITIVRWRDDQAEELVLLSPLGRRFDRRTPRSVIRWHEGSNFDLVTLTSPTPGDWQFRAGAAADTKILAIGDLALQVGGLAGVMFPGGPQAFSLSLRGDQGRIVDAQFVDLLEVGAQLVGPAGDQAVVVTRHDDAFRLEVLELAASGDHVLNLQVHGPTFERSLAVPFVVRNPLTLDVRPGGDDRQAAVWVDVRAPGVDPASLQVVAKLRRPPDAARLVPATRAPAGLWKVDLADGTGSQEFSLEVTGKHLDDRDFRLRTEVLRMRLPIRSQRTIALDASGKELQAALRAVSAPPAPPGSGPLDPSDPTSNTQPAPVPEAGTVLNATPVYAVLPLWLAGLTGVIAALFGAAFWWFLKPAGQRHQLPERLAELRRAVTASE